jgi:RNA polymerase sigma factor (sigma-70 family)
MLVPDRKGRTGMSHGQLDTTSLSVYFLPDEDPAAEGSDQELLQHYLGRRDEGAFAALVRRHGTLVLSVCRAVLGHAQDAEDAFQAAFLVLARQAGSIRKGDSVASWLYGVAYRVARKAKRAMARRGKYERQAQGRPSEQPPSEAALRELQAILHDEIQRLPEKHRAPFVLCCLEGKSREEAAQELGCKEGTVSCRVARAREQLRRRLVRRGVALSAALCAGAVALSSASAAVQPALAAAAVRGAIAFGSGSAARSVPPPALTLARGLLRSRGLGRVATVLAVGVLLTLLAGGLGVAAWQVAAARADETPAAAGAPEPPESAAGPAEQNGPPPGPRLALPLPPADRAFAAHGWNVRPDPPREPPRGPFQRGVAVPIAFLGQTVYPTLPSAFVALTPDGRGPQRRLQVYDLRRMQPVGAPVEAAFDPFHYTSPALSPDGARLAAIPKQDPRAVVEIWSTTTGRGSRLQVAADGGRRAGMVDFLGPDRILVMIQNGTFPDWQSGAVYQVWDFKARKVLAQFSHDLLFHPKWGAISPGGKYLVMEETDNGRGYRLLFWDLSTGKRAADLEFQPRNVAWGQAAGMAFSPDGEELAMLWRLGKADGWGRLLCWDVRTGRKLADHKVGQVLPLVDSLWLVGGQKCLTWLPDRRGWLLFGCVFLDRKSGAVLRTLSPEPQLAQTMIERRFLDRDHMTTVEGNFRKTFSITTAPR